MSQASYFYFNSVLRKIKVHSNYMRSLDLSFPLFFPLIFCFSTVVSLQLPGMQCNVKSTRHFINLDIALFCLQIALTFFVCSNHMIKFCPSEPHSVYLFL